jgi:hypothetical protein
MADPTGQSAPDHEGTYLEPDDRDDEVLTMTRRDLRILLRTFSFELLDRLDTITPGATHRHHLR